MRGSHPETPVTRSPRRIAIIGAGLSGLVAARNLSEKGHEITLFDKGRGPGGRISSRRRPFGGDRQWVFDHGAPGFLIRDRELLRLCEQWWQEGALSPWFPKATVTNDQLIWVSDGRMSALGRYLARGLDINQNTPVDTTKRRDGQWSLWSGGRQLHGSGGSSQFDDLLTATPAKQAKPFLTSSFDWSTLAEDAEYEACWSVMIGFRNRPEISGDVVHFDDNMLDFAVRNTSKPGRSSLESWTLYTRPKWSQDHLECPSPLVAEWVLARFQEQLQGGPMHPSWLEAHRWRYARPWLSQKPECHYDVYNGLGICGDWTHWTPEVAGGVEAALLSGLAVSRDFTAVHGVSSIAKGRDYDGITHAACSPTRP